MIKKDLLYGQVVRTRNNQFLTFLPYHPKHDSEKHYPDKPCFVSKYDYYLSACYIDDDLLCNEDNINARGCDIMEVYEQHPNKSELISIWKRDSNEIFCLTIEEIEEEIQHILKGRKLVIKQNGGKK